MALRLPNRFKRLCYWIVGKQRLMGGFCPSCNSSPPRTDCWVCQGDRDYWRGHEQWTKEKAEAWRVAYLEGVTSGLKPTKPDYLVPFVLLMWLPIWLITLIVWL